MVDASAIVSIVIAVVSLLGTLAVAVFSHFSSRALQATQAETEAKIQATQAITERELEVHRNQLAQQIQEKQEERQGKKQLEDLTTRYSQPLLIAAYELEARLYELLEYPISKQHLESEEGLDDIKIFTCYKFARFLAWTHILKSRTQYFSFTKDSKLKNIGGLIFRLDEEFDRRRDKFGQNIGVWPGSRILVSERMLRDASNEKEIPLDTIVKDYKDFRHDWENDFRSPMGYFCQWIDDLVAGRKEREAHWDDAMRCTQHNLVDMIEVLDTSGLIHPLKRCEDPLECDCKKCNPLDQSVIEFRGSSRYNDKGLRPWYDHRHADTFYDSSISTEAIKAMTCTKLYNQGDRTNE